MSDHAPKKIRSTNAQKGVYGVHINGVRGSIIVSIMSSRTLKKDVRPTQHPIAQLTQELTLNTRAYLLIWFIIAIGSVYFTLRNVVQANRKTAGSLGRVGTMVWGLVALSAVLRIGTILHWWRFLYAGHR